MPLELDVVYNTTSLPRRRDNSTLFSSSYGSDTNTSKTAFVERGWVILGLNIRLKGYVYRQHLYIVRWGNGSTTTFPLEVFT